MSCATLPGAQAPAQAAACGLLDPLKRALLLKLVAKGLSRRAAARVVGCHVATVGRTAARDPQFAQRLAEAEEALTLEVLEHVLGAARNPRYWRAAAWVLERADPDRYAARRPKTVSAEELGNVLHRVLAAVAATGVPASRLDEIESRVQRLLLDAEEGDWDRVRPYLGPACDDPDEPLLPEPLAASMGETLHAGDTPGAYAPGSPVAETPPSAEASARNAPLQSGDSAIPPQVAAAEQVTPPMTASAGRATPVQGVARSGPVMSNGNQRKPDGRPSHGANAGKGKKGKHRHARTPAASPGSLTWEDLDELPAAVLAARGRQ